MSQHFSIQAVPSLSFLPDHIADPQELNAYKGVAHTSQMPSNPEEGSLINEPLNQPLW